MACCFCCGRSQGRAGTWRSAAALRGQDEARVNFESGLSHCCARGATDSLLERQLRRLGLGAPPRAPAACSPLAGARRLHEPGAGLDEAFLDGLGAVGWVSARPLDLEDSLGGLGLQLQLHARVLPPATSASWRSEQAQDHHHKDFWRRASTQVLTRAELRLVLRGEQAGDLERRLRVDVWLPAPVRGYIEFRGPQCGVRMCPNLRLGLLANEVESTPGGSRVLVGPRTAEQSTARLQTVKLTAKWRGPQLLRVSLSVQLEEEMEASLAEVLRALFGKEACETSLDEKGDLASLFIEAVKRRAPFVADADARGAKFETLLEEHVLVSLSGQLEERSRRAAAHIAELLTPCAPRLAAQPADLAAAVRAVAPQPGRQAVAVVDERTDAALDGTDLLARLYCRALAPTLMPGTEDPSEHAKEVLSPASISAAALRRALLATLARLRKDVQAELLRVQRGPAEQGGEGEELKAQLRCGGCAGELPCSVCAPPARQVVCRYCMAKRPQQCTSACAAPPPCAKMCQPGEPARCAKRLLRVRWPLAETSCPLCGSEGPGECERCQEEQQLEALWLPVAEGASRRQAQHLEMRPGAAAWWEAPRLGLLRLVRHRAWLRRGGASATLLALALGRLGAAELAHELPTLMLRKLRGPGAGTRADAPREERGVKRREPPCLLSEDTSLNDATSVGTGLRSSQVGREGWLRRRHPRTKRGRADHFDTNEKTKGQKEAAPASLRFAPSALLDAEDERAAVEATQAVLAAMEAERGGAGPAPRHCRLLVEHCGLAGRSRRWRRARPGLSLPGDELGARADVWLSLEEAVLLHRRLRRELDERMAEFRVDELVGLPAAGRGRVCREAVVQLHSGETVATESFTLGRRLPRRGDQQDGRTVSSLEALLVRVEGEPAPRHVAVADLRKLPPRGGSFPPLAFVNAVFEPRQGHVNVRLAGGHRVTLVQLQRLREAAPTAEGEEGEWQLLWRQLCGGELGFWHTATLCSEEAHGEESQRLRGDEPPLTFSLPLGELQLHCPRALALPPPPGHPVRQGPQLRAMASCCSEKPLCLKAADGCGPVTAPSAWSPTVSDGRFGAGGHGARAQGALFSVAYLDHYDGSTYEDAGSTTEQFAQEQGRCFALATPLQVRGQDKRSRSILSLAELRSRLPEKDADTDHRFDHLDSSGRARGFVCKGTTLAVLQNGEHVRAPFDAWVEDWDETRRGVDVVVLVVQHGWLPGIKVVWQLQKSVLTSVPNGLWAAGTAISFNRSQESIRSRNTPAIGTSAKALKLLHARGARLTPSNEEPGLLAHRRLRGLESLFLREDCSLERVEAARELTWGLCTADRYPVIYQESGQRAGVANIWLQEMGIPLAKAAPHVLVAHVGGRGRRGFEPSRGGCLEWTERNTLQEGGFDATRPLLPEVEDSTLLKWQGPLSCMGCAVYRSGEADEEKSVWELLTAAERNAKRPRPTSPPSAERSEGKRAR